MSGHFAACAVRAMGLAAQMLGWRPDEFWRATPCELAHALAPLAAAPPEHAGRDDLRRMMEQEHER